MHANDGVFCMLTFMCLFVHIYHNFLTFTHSGKASSMETVECGNHLASCGPCDAADAGN